MKGWLIGIGIFAGIWLIGFIMEPNTQEQIADWRRGDKPRTEFSVFQGYWTPEVLCTDLEAFCGQYIQHTETVDIIVGGKPTCVWWVNHTSVSVKMNGRWSKPYSQGKDIPAGAHEAYRVTATSSGTWRDVAGRHHQGGAMVYWVRLPRDRPYDCNSKYIQAIRARTGGYQGVFNIIGGSRRDPIYEANYRYSQMRMISSPDRR